MRGYCPAQFRAIPRNRFTSHPDPQTARRQQKGNAQLKAMPHLRYCNRYWYVAGDELSCPALCSLLSRMVWTALVAAVYGVAHNHLSDCSNGWLIQAYLLISIIVFVADIVCDGLIIFVSMQGGIPCPPPLCPVTG